MPNELFDEYQRLMDEACSAIAEAKRASDRGDTGEYQRLLARSIELGDRASKIMRDRQGKRDRPVS